MKLWFVPPLQLWQRRLEMWYDYWGQIRNVGIVMIRFAAQICRCTHEALLWQLQ